MSFAHRAKKIQQARYDEEDRILANLDKEVNAENLMYFSQNYKRLKELRKEMKEATEQREQMKRENPTSQSFDVHCYRIRMISEAQKQPLETW